MKLRRWRPTPLMVLVIAGLVATACVGSADESTVSAPTDAPSPTATAILGVSTTEPVASPIPPVGSPTATPDAPPSPSATVEVLPVRPRAQDVRIVDGLMVAADSYGLWTRMSDTEPWNLLPFPNHVVQLGCWVAEGQILAGTAVLADGETRELSIVHTTLSPTAPPGTWTSYPPVSSRSLGPSSCPVFSDDGSIYVAVPMVSESRIRGLELLQAKDGELRRRVLSEDAESGSTVELHVDGGDLIVGFCQGSDMFPCDRNLAAVDPESFFGGADFFFSAPCADGAAEPVCSFDFTVPYDGRLSGVGDAVWQLELHETLGTVPGGEWPQPFGRWAAAPLGTEPVPLPIGFDPDLFLHEGNVVARVPLAQKWDFVVPEYQWFLWSPEQRSWTEVEFSIEGSSD